MRGLANACIRTRRKGWTRVLVSIRANKLSRGMGYQARMTRFARPTREELEKIVIRFPLMTPYRRS